MDQTTMRPEPAKGMRDILPAEAAIRERLQRAIVDTYRAWGFERVETPTLERIEVLLGSKSGENEKMVFKILKRGEKLERAGDDLADSGLRFDLTVPLARFVAANINSLPMPFKALQIGPVFRAERPQKGRFRQFTQCDLDVIGMAAPFAELELVAATGSCLATLGFRDFKVRLNDKRLLVAMCHCSGYEGESVGHVLTALDKSDKIGLDGVCDELAPIGADKAKALVHLVQLARETRTAAEFVRAASLEVAREAADHIDFVVEAAARPGAAWAAAFDATLVRGMGYYTGMVFEVGHGDYPFSFAGGGRYDDMIGRFLGRSLQACGFSIGFERLVTALSDAKAVPDTGRSATVLLVATTRAAACAHELAAHWRAQGQIVSVLPQPEKKVSRFIEELYAAGHGRVASVGEDGSVSEKVRL